MGKVLNVSSKIIGAYSKLKPIDWVCNKFAKDPEKAIAAATVTSIVAKDGIGCAMYVYQSMTNDKIPDERRPFVCALDLTNGGLMIVAQILMFLGMRKYSGPIFDKLFRKSFNAITNEHTVSRIRMQAARAGEAVAKKLKIQKAYDKVKENAAGTFKFVLDIAAATIIGKRVIVPLIATPMASKVEKYFKRKNPSFEGQDKNNEQITDKQEVAQNVDVVVTHDNQSTNLLDRYRK